MDKLKYINFNRLFLVTPLKDERLNIDYLVDSISSQSIPIFTWVIVENDSIDGSREYLDEIEKINNVTHLRILNIETVRGIYDIGFKISEILQYGFDYVEREFQPQKEDFIGVLDADSFPVNNYYEVLIDALEVDEKLGLVSGVLKLKNGKRDKVSDYTIRGSGRVWKYDCFRTTAIYHGMGADRTSQFRAELNGWRTKVIKEVSFISRELDIRVDYKYRGQSDYYNGCTLLYALCKSIFLIFRKSARNWRYILGYLEYYIKGSRKNPDKLILDYNRKNLTRVLKRLLSRKLNFNDNT